MYITRGLISMPVFQLCAPRFHERLSINSHSWLSYVMPWTSGVEPAPVGVTRPVDPDWAAPPMLSVTFDRSRPGRTTPWRMLLDLSALYPTLKSFTMLAEITVVRSPIAFLGSVSSTVALPPTSLGVVDWPWSCE